MWFLDLKRLQILGAWEQRRGREVVPGSGLTRGAAWEAPWAVRGLLAAGCSAPLPNIPGGQRRA